jgi:hypothetical protein
MSVSIYCLKQKRPCAVTAEDSSITSLNNLVLDMHRHHLVGIFILPRPADHSVEERLDVRKHDY